MLIRDDEVSLSPEMRQALASLRLESIELSKESLADIRLFDEGKLSKDDVVKRVLARVSP